MEGIKFVHDLGTKGYFQEGFTATDYTAARDLLWAAKPACITWVHGKL